MDTEPSARIVAVLTLSVLCGLRSAETRAEDRTAAIFQETCGSATPGSEVEDPISGDTERVFSAPSPSGHDIYWQRRIGDSWLPPVLLTGNGDNFEPTLSVLDSSGDRFVVYTKDGKTPGIYLARNDSRTGDWIADIRLSAPKEDTRFPSWLLCHNSLYVAFEARAEGLRRKVIVAVFDVDALAVSAEDAEDSISELRSLSTSTVLANRRDCPRGPRCPEYLLPVYSSITSISMQPQIHVTVNGVVWIAFLVHREAIPYLAYSTFDASATAWEPLKWSPLERDTLQEALEELHPEVAHELTEEPE